MTPAAGEMIIDTTNNRPNIGDGVRAGGYQIPNFSDIQKQAFTYAVAGGSANAITLAYTVPTVGDVDGLELGFKATANNSGSVTIAVDGRSAATVKKISGGVLADLEADDIINGGYYKYCRIGSIYLIKGLREDVTSASGWELLQINTGGGTTYDVTSVISADFVNYAFLLKNILPSATGTPTLGGRVRRSGQGSFDGSSGHYEGNLTAGVPENAVGPEALAALQGVSANSYMPFAAGCERSAGGGFGASGLIMAYGLGVAARAFFVSNVSTHDGTTCIQAMGSSFRDTATALDGFQLRFSSGNISSGEMYTFGIRSSL